MKELKKKLTVVLIIFLFLFVLLAGYLLYDVFMHSGRWISSSYNPRLDDQRSSVIPGSIYDVNGVELAGSSYGERTYIEDDQTRHAVCHVIGDVYGFSPLGVETTQGAWLLGFNENLIDRIKRILVSETAAGSDLTLTLDSELNVEAASLLEGYSGSVVVLNYETGEILSMVSLPEFDLAEIDVNYENGGADAESLVNRALQSEYLPGRLFSVVTYAAAIENLDTDSYTYLDEGKYETEDGTVYGTSILGEVDFSTAFTNFCETAIADISNLIGSNKLKKMAHSLGFSNSFLFNDIVLYESEVTISSLDTDYETALAGLGEYGVTVTPMHMAMLYGAIANGGEMMPLKLLSDIEGVDMSKRSDSFRKSFDADTAEILNELLSECDTVYADDVEIYGIYTEVEDEDSEDYDTITWYAGYSGNDDYPYSIAVVIEDYDEGEDELKEIVQQIFEYIIGIGE